MLLVFLGLGILFFFLNCVMDVSLRLPAEVAHTVRHYLTREIVGHIVGDRVEDKQAFRRRAHQTPSNTGFRALGVGVPILLTTGTIKIRVRERVSTKATATIVCYDHAFGLLGLLVRHNHQCEGNRLERPSRARVAKVVTVLNDWNDDDDNGKASNRAPSPIPVPFEDLT